ncbi:hypothetical protein HYT84_05005, partial [Candidatus Micrarchaeota archaeon]|nr:hypothetical protein [Candidatus Micrarchaeota archaeon]
LFGFTPEEHGELGQIINRLRDTAKKKNNLIEQTIADDMDIFVTGFVKLNQMRILTGESGLGPRGRVIDALYKLARLPIDGMKNVPGLNRIPIIKDIPGIGRLPFMGGFIGTSIDAFFRSARIQGRIGRALAGEVVRTVGRVKEDKLAEYKKIAEASETGWLKRQLAETMIAGSPISVKIGYYVPIQRQMAELYKNLYTEAHQDVTRYLLKKIFERYGVKFDLTEMEVTEIGYRYFDIMERSGFKNNPNVAKLREVEAEIKKILSKAATSADPEEYYQLLYERVREIKKVAARYSVAYDERGVDSVLEQVRGVHEQKGVEAHVKLLSLYDYLIRVHKIDQPIGNDVEQKRAKGEFYFTIGRDSLTLRRNNQEVFSDLWEVYSLRNYIYNAENAYLRGNLEDVIKGNYVYLVSRMLGLGSKFLGPDGKIDPEVKRIMEQVLGPEKRPTEGLLYSLLTDAGKYVAADSEVFNFKNDPKKLLSGFDYFKILQGGEGRELYAKFGDIGANIEDRLKPTAENILGFPQTLGRRMADIGFKDKRGKMQFYEETTEIAPLPEWWKVDMKRDWKSGNAVSGREVAIREYIDALLAKTKQFAHLPYSPVIERELGSQLTTGNIGNYKKLMAREILATEMYDFINGVMGMNTYKYTNETMRLYIKQAQGLLFGFFSQKSKDDKTGEYDRIARELETMRIVAGEDNNRDIKRLSELLTKYNGEFTEFLAAPISYDTMKKSKSAWVQFHEGGLAPYVHGMPMSDFDRVMNGHVAIKDSNGKWRRFDPPP